MGIGLYRIGLDAKYVAGTLFREFTDDTRCDECEEVAPRKNPNSLHANLDSSNLTRKRRMQLQGCIEKVHLFRTGEQNLSGVRVIGAAEFRNWRSSYDVGLRVG